MKTKMDPVELDDLFFRPIVGSYVNSPRFLRRDWLADELEEHLQSPSCRFVLLTAEPGAGKSAFISQLASDHPHWPVYFIRRDQRTSLGDISTHSFLLRIGFQLAATYPELFSLEQVRLVVEQRIGEVANKGSVVGAEVDKILTSPFHQTVVRIQQEVQRAQGQVSGLRIREWVADPRLLDESDLQNMALFDPLRALRQLQTDRRITILIDALDELRYHQTEHTLLHWLTHCPQLPDNVRFVLTSRPPEGALVTFIEKQQPYLSTFTISDQDDRVQRDLQDYTRGLVAREEVASALQETESGIDGFVDEAVAKADGNIGYLDALGRGIDQALSFAEGRPTLQELLALRQLPAHTQGLYTFFLHQIKNGPGSKDIKVTDPQSGRSGLLEAWPDLYYPLLAVLSVALEPLTLDQLKVMTGTLAERVYVAQAVEWLSNFLDRIEDRYRLYHASLAEFLTSDATQAQPETTDLYVAPAAMHRRLARQIGGQAGSIWKDDREDPEEQGQREYARLHYITHLFLGEDWDLLFQVLDEGEYGQGKLRYNPSTYLYARDLELARVATTRQELAQEEALELLPRLWKYSLLRCSLASEAEVLPVNTYVALVMLGRADEAEGLAELVTNPERQASIFSNVACVFGQQPEGVALAGRLLRRAFQVAHQIRDVEKRRSALDEFLNHMWFLLEAAEFKDSEVAASARQLADTCTHGANRAEVLGSLARYLSQCGFQGYSNALVAELLRLPDSLADLTEADGARFAVAAACADLGRFEQARGVAEAIEHPEQRISALAHLAVAQYRAGSENDAKAILAQAHNMAMTAPDRGFKAQALETVSRVWAAMGCREQAVLQLKEALGLLQGQPIRDIDPRTLGSLAQGLWRLNEEHLAVDALQLARAAVMVSIDESEAKPGEGFNVPVRSMEAARTMAQLDQWRMAYEIASALPLHGRPSVLEAVVEALVRNSDWDKASVIIDEIARIGRESQVNFGFSSQRGILPNSSSESRALCTVVAGLARDRNWSQAIAMAERLSDLGDIEAHCYALSNVAIEQLKNGQLDLASDCTDKQRRLVRLWNTRIGKEEALRKTIDLLVRSAEWSGAQEVARQIESPRERMYAWVSIAKGLIEAADLIAAQSAIKEIEDPAERAQTTITQARKLSASNDMQGALDALSQAQQHAADVSDDMKRSSVLRSVALAFFEMGQHQRAEQLMFDACDSLSRVTSFAWRPTPWCDLCGDFAKIGRWDVAVGLVRGLPQEEVFDRATALRNICRIAWDSGRRDEASSLLSEARALARDINFPPKRDSFMVSLAGELAHTGQYDQALKLAEDLETPQWRVEALDSVAEQLAEERKLEDALALIEKVGNSREPERALKAIVSGFLARGLPDKALDIARSIKEPSGQVSALAEIASHLFTLGRPEDAQGLLYQVRDLAHSQTSTRFGFVSGTLEDVATRLARAGKYNCVVTVVQREWLRMNTRRDLLGLIPMANALVDLRPVLGNEIYGSFGWIEEFLQGV
jgi:tetratricopeptide (TPR) repeat protein